MQNQRFSRNIFGPLRTQEMAQEALPILISHAQRGLILTLRELATEIAPDLTHFNYPREPIAGEHPKMDRLLRFRRGKTEEISNRRRFMTDDARIKFKRLYSSIER